jgi:proteasome lid subunit RPN8/RPN11
LLHLTDELLTEARTFFEERGAQGCEGTAMIARTQKTGAVRLVVPEQRANPVPNCWVEVTTNGKFELARSLAEDERYVARIHSHPGAAFHSSTDDRNPALSFDGALSIVVPYFGLGLRSGLDNCAVYVLRSLLWAEVAPGAERDAVVAHD